MSCSCDSLNGCWIFHRLGCSFLARMISWIHVILQAVLLWKPDSQNLCPCCQVCTDLSASVELYSWRGWVLPRVSTRWTMQPFFDFDYRLRYWDTLCSRWTQAKRHALGVSEIVYAWELSISYGSVGGCLYFWHADSPEKKKKKKKHFKNLQDL